MKKCLIWANGESPPKSLVKKIIKLGYDQIICADGGANSAYAFGFVPNYVVGDFDSVSPKVLTAFEKSSEIIRYRRQNDTDVEKALKLAIAKKFRRAVLIGATGDRLDHSLCNLGVLLKYRDKIDITMVHGKTGAYVLQGEIEFKTTPGEIISIYAFDDKTKIKSGGLKYPLKNISLPFGAKESTSNVATGGKVKLEITAGKVIIVRELKALFENGFFF
jgi:thiamine pyrophosphokinase